MRELLDVEEGKPYDFFAVRDGVQKLEERLRERGYLQSRVRLSARSPTRRCGCTSR